LDNGRQGGPGVPKNEGVDVWQGGRKRKHLRLLGVVVFCVLLGFAAGVKIKKVGKMGHGLFVEGGGRIQPGLVRPLMDSNCFTSQQIEISEKESGQSYKNSWENSPGYFGRGLKTRGARNENSSHQKQRSKTVDATPPKPNTPLNETSSKIRLKPFVNHFFSKTTHHC